MLTEEKKPFNELKQSQLLHYAQDLTMTYHELQKKASELEALNKKKTDFLIMVSHEIRTPVTKMLLLANAIENQFCSLAEDNIQQPGNLSKLIDTLKGSAWTLQTVLSEVVLAAEHGRNEVPYNFTPLRINTFIKELVEVISPFFKKRKQKIITEFKDEQILVAADKLRIYDVIFNIVQNASKFSEDGETIYIRTGRRDNMAVIEIEDHGIGIEKSKIDAIFTPFYEGNDIMTHQSGNFEFKSSRLGMGLYIAKRIVDAHNGIITVESTPGKGSIFSIYLLVEPGE